MRSTYKDRDERSVCGFFFLERRTAMKLVKIKTIQSQAKCCVSLLFLIFYSCDIICRI